MRWTDLAVEPDLGRQVADVESAMPVFLRELTAAARTRVAASDPAATAVLVQDAQVVAVVRAVRLRWDGDRSTAPAGGAREALQRAEERDADTLAVLDVVVAERWRGHGIGSAVLAGLDAWRLRWGLERVLVLLRPHAKADYPLVPFARYVSAVTADGEPFDPWLRTAWRGGLVPVRAADRSLVARAALPDWQRWLGRPVPGSGPYLVPGAIKPAILEVERDTGGYREPHLWAAPASTVAPAGGIDAGTSPGEGWVAALAAAGVVAGDRSHREVRRRR